MNFTAYDIQDVLDGYYESAEWADSPEGEDYYDVTRDGEDSVRSNIESFMNDNVTDVKAYLNDITAINATPLSHLGHDLYLSAAGHGTGFWDRGLGELGERLHKASKGMTCEVWVEDKILHISY